MLALRPQFLWKEKPSEAVNPKFIHGYKGWLFVLTGSFLLLGFYRFVAMSENSIKVFQDWVGYDQVPAILWLFVVLLDICLPLCIAFVLYFRWYDPLLISRGCAIVLPIAAFSGFWLFPPIEKDWRISSVIAFTSNALFFTIPTLFYLGLSRRVRNTYMFWGRRFPAGFNVHSVCPYSSP